MLLRLLVNQYLRDATEGSCARWSWNHDERRGGCDRATEAKFAARRHN